MAATFREIDAYARPVGESKSKRQASALNDFCGHAMIPDMGSESNPTQSDIYLVGRVSENISNVLASRIDVRDVYVARGTIEHYRRRHSQHIDLDRAESLVGQTIAKPITLYQGTKRETVVFVGQYDDQHYLLIPVKALPEELWQESLYIDEVTRFHRRGWVRSGLLWKAAK